MSEHRRKPPQRGGRAAARRAAQQQPRGRRGAAPPPPPPAPPGAGATRGAHAAAAGGPGDSGPRPYGGRAEARRAARAAGRRGHRAGGEGARGRGRRGQAPSAKKRFIDYPRSGKQGFRRWVPSWKLVLGTCFTFFALFVGLIGIALFMVEMPPANAVAKAKTNVYYWDDGEPMVTTGGEYNRQPITLSEMPSDLQWAVIAAENESFYDDRGVDPMGIARAVVNMARGQDTQSGSTITQQYVKNTYLTTEQSITRKARELLLSIKLGVTEEKADILEGYLNTAYYGRSAYGAQAAAQTYFGKDATDLNTAESVFLATLVNGAGYYDPAGTDVGDAETNRKRAEARWSWILDRMVAIDRLAPEKRDKLKKQGLPDIEPPRKDSKLGGQVGYLVELARNYVVAHADISRKQLDQGGYRIYTTFNRKKVEQMQKTVEKVRKDNLQPKKRDADKFVQFGGAAVVPGDGAIVAIYGGQDATEHFNNNSDYTGAQVGSTFKPFVMAAALRDGKRDPDLPPDQGPESRTKVSPKSVYDGDSRIKLRDYNGEVWLNKENKEWHQPNEGDTDYGDITLYKAMEVSANTPFIQLGMDVGLDKVKQAAIDAGIPDTGQTYARTTPTFSLGTSAPSAIRLANAYGTFAKSGNQVEPYSVTRVVDSDGNEAYKHERSSKEAFEPAVADTITDMLQRVVKQGTGKSAQLPDGRPVAGKTGTTDQNQTAWFAGYTPQLSTAIGMWRIDTSAKVQRFLSMNGTAGKESIHGADFPAEIWQGFMTKALKGEPSVPFEKPEPIGTEVEGTGVTPSPTATPPPSPDPSTSPTEDPSSSPSAPTPSETPGPTDTCRPWDWACRNSEGQTGGEDNGGTDGGADGGTDGGPGGGPGGPGGDTGEPGDTEGGDDDGGGAIFGREGR